MTTKTILDRIHKQALSNFTYKTDKENHGVLENWAAPDEFWQPGKKFVGDCDDFAMYCRALAREHGLKSRLVLCYTETGEGHLVLECEGWILDNRMRKVEGSRSPALKGYKWKYISGYEPGDSWWHVTL